MTLTLGFEGWFQCRVATDPDPTDEPRGVSGFTFALPGEPDLDGVIRFRDPDWRTLRTHGPTVGVSVHCVAVDGRPAPPRHPLAGAGVELLPDTAGRPPRFVERNGVVSGPDERPIDPFRLRVSAGRAVLERTDLLDPKRPSLRAEQATRQQLARRFAVETKIDPATVASATGIADPLAFRRQRRSMLELDRDREEDGTRRLGLEKRIRELSLEDPKDRRTWTLSVLQRWRFDLNGPGRAVGVEADATREWPLEFWMGGFDADSLCAYVKGSLVVPLR
jgi:hypothetical protein